jgi:hypothetical protein
MSIQGLIELTDETSRTQTKRKYNPKFPELEAALSAWINASRMANLVVPPSMVRQKAQQIAYSLNISSDDFSGSHGWYYRFAKGINLHAINLHGEGGEVHRNDPLLLEKFSALERLIESYDTNNVYNMDETELFFRMMPQYTVLMPNEDASTVCGMKIQK